MAENYSLNSSFGYNIAGKNLAPNQNKTGNKFSGLNETIGNIVDSITNFVAKDEDVYNGDVAKEIGMYSRQSMIVGMNLKAADKTIRKLDINA